MGRKREVFYHNGRYQGKYLSDKDCDKLEKILALREGGSGQYFKDLEGIIYDMPTAEIDRILFTGNTDDVEEYVHGKLRPYQTLTVAYALVAKRWLCGDSVGLGKTVEIAAIHNFCNSHNSGRRGKGFQTLFLTKNSALNQVQREMVRFTGEHWEGITGQAADVDRFIDSFSSTGGVPNTVGTHSLVSSPEFQNFVTVYKAEHGYGPFDMVVMDESSVLSNTKTQIYTISKKLFEDVEYKVCLNATEFSKHLLDFFNQLNWADDTFLPTKTEFQKTYCVMKRNNFGYGFIPDKNNYKNPEKFRHAIGYRYFVETRKNIGATMEDSEAVVYATEENDYLRQQLKLTSTPSMAINCPWAIDRNASIAVDFCPKIAAVQDFFKRVLNSGRGEGMPQYIIYANYKESQEGLRYIMEVLGISYEVINGETPAEEREKIREDFKEGGFAVLITNVARALNLDFVDNLIFYEFPNIAEAIQFEGRITRGMSIKGKRVFIFLSEAKELKDFLTNARAAARELSRFTETDHSMLLNLLVQDEIEVISTY